MRARSVFFAIATVAHVVACGGSPEPARPPSAPTPPATTPASEAPAPSAATTEAPKAPEPPKALEAKPPTLKVLEAGAAPRRALRYKFKAGVTEYATMDLKMSMSMAIGPKEMPKIDLPTMRATMRIDAKEVTPEGDAKVTYETLKFDVVKDAKADPKVTSALEQEIGGLVGMKGRATVSPRGVTKENEFELPPSASPKLQGQMDSMRDAIKNMYMPLPEEEVGKGAKWEVTSRIPTSGAMMDMVATYTLTGLTPDGAQANVDVVLSAEPNQRLDVPGMPNVTATLDSLSGKTTGQTSPSFTKLVGTANTKATMQLVSSASLHGDKVTTKVTSDITVGIHPTKAPAKK